MKPMEKTSPIYRFLSQFSWPLLLVICVSVTQIGFVNGYEIVAFNFAYAFLAISLLVLERLMPYEAEWQEDDGQTSANIMHTLLSKGTVQTLIIFSTAIGLSHLVSPMSEAGHGIWPRDWPLWVQVAMGVSLAEFGLYWAHRIAHEWLSLWRFHAIHHSVNRLWVINTGRFHFIDSVVSISFGFIILVSLGAPMEVLVWLSAITAFIGMLTHCNVDMQPGWLSYIFNTPNLHRWHHSRDIREGNKNYGENLMLWDQLFRTFYNPDRRPPVNIGVNEYIPPTFAGQIMHPFQMLLRRRRRAKSG